MSAVKTVRQAPGAKLINGITESMNRVTDILEVAFPKTTALPPTPVRKQNAIETAITLEKEWLSKRELAQLVNVFESHAFASEGYKAVMQDEELRKEWVKAKLGLL
jgi:hypothetical protein